MQTTAQLAEDFDALHCGHWWIGYSATEILADVTFEMAMVKAYEKGNSIWQLVNHLSYWREVVARRITEQKGIEADRTGLDIPEQANAEEWERTKARFNASYTTFKTAVESLPEEKLAQPLGEKGSNYFNINGCIEHDSYHLGQVMLLKQLALSLSKKK